MQWRGNGVKRGANNAFPENTKTLKGHDLYMGSLLFLTKSAPSPRFRANIYMKYDVHNGRITMNEEMEKATSRLDELLRGRIENDNIEIHDVETDITA